MTQTGSGAIVWLRTTEWPRESIMALAPDGETLPSTAARESAAGSGHHLEVAESHDLKGIDGHWLLHQLIDHRAAD